MDVEIIAVGTELLLGDILNTNARFLANNLSAVGANVFFQTVVGDNEKRLRECIENAFKRVDTVIFTGGLGPTEDDITKEAVSEYFGLSLTLHKESLCHIENYFERLGKKMIESNKKQAMVPQGARVLENQNGTAPGLIIEKDKKRAVLLPGPPREMEKMFLKSVLPYFKELSGEIIFSRMLKVFGVGESKAESMILDIIKNQTNPTVAPYAKDGEMCFRLTAKAKSEKEANALLDEKEKEIRGVLGSFVYGTDDEAIESAAVKRLLKDKMTVATAESCTGGLLAGKIVNVAGASEVFKMGIVSYANEVKEKELGVLDEVLSTKGAVSEECAIAMAEGVRKKANSDVGISTTGIAGPGGGSEQKPVGTVYIGVSTKEKSYAKRFNFAGERNYIREVAAKNALNLIRLLGDDENDM